MTSRIKETSGVLPTYGLLDLLRLERDELNASSRKICDVVLADPALSVSETLTELAERAQVSESSIVRFVRQQGFKRFHEFKVALAFDAAQEAAHSYATRESPQEHVLPHLLLQAQRALEQTHAHLDAPELQLIAQRLAEADQILLYGAGASGVIALEFQYKLLRLGLRVTALRDVHTAALHAAQLTDRSVLFAISRSGASIDTLQVMRIARSCHAVTAIVTGKPRSTAAHLAQHVLLAVGTESPIEGGSLNTEISALFLLNALYVTLLDQLPNAREIVHRTAQAISDQRE